LPDDTDQPKLTQRDGRNDSIEHGQAQSDGPQHEYEHREERDHEHEHDHEHGLKHDHEHDHDHDHQSRSAPSSIARRVNELIALLERKGITDEHEIAVTIERFLAGAGPANGAHLVARAWTDPAFKSLLLADANAAIASFGLDLAHWAPVRMRAVENSAQVHNVIVCTLCSCYPIALLGPSPAWYKSEAYRSRVVREPRAVLREFGCPIPDTVEIRVWDSTAELRYLVIPRRPSGTAGLSESQLRDLVTRDALIGVAEATKPPELDTAR
jgi:nitrile hydratase